MRRSVLTVTLALSPILALPAAAGAATTIGGNLASTADSQNCATGCSFVQTTLPVPAGEQVAAGHGVITRWRAVGVGPGSLIVVQINKTTGVATQVRASDPGTLAAGAPVNASRVPIEAGQYTGMTVNGGSVAFTPGVTGAQAFGYVPALAAGLAQATATPPPGVQSTVAYQAVVEPDADNDGFGDESQDKCPAEPNAAVPGGPCVAPAYAARPKVKTVRQGTASKLTFSLSEAAAVKAKIELKSTGRRVGKSCRKPSRGNAKRRRCTRFAVKGRKTFAAKAGANTFSLGKLKAGSYRLTLTATDKNGAAAAPVTTNFTVKPKPKPKRFRNPGRNSAPVRG